MLWTIIDLVNKWFSFALSLNMYLELFVACITSKKGHNLAESWE